MGEKIYDSSKFSKYPGININQTFLPKLQFMNQETGDEEDEGPYGNENSPQPPTNPATESSSEDERQSTSSSGDESSTPRKKAAPVKNLRYSPRRKAKTAAGAKLKRMKHAL